MLLWLRIFCHSRGLCCHCSVTASSALDCDALDVLAIQVPFLGEGDIPKHLMGMDDGGDDAMDVDKAGAAAGQDMNKSLVHGALCCT